MPLGPIACHDSDPHAAAARHLLDIDRSSATHLGRTAVQAIRVGHYPLQDHRTVDWSNALATAIAAKISIPPEAALPDARGPRFASTSVLISNETTLMAAHRLTSRGARPLVLNMANGVNPGGGFLHGARAQEETLCRSSGLFATLEGDPMYAAHQATNDYESSDWMILSPEVPVYRTDDGTPIAEYWLCDFVTSAAPYAPRVGQPRSSQLMTKRIERLLQIAAAHDYENLILGAWGCGAFGNHPAQTAADFATLLTGQFDGHFQEVVFAITDWSPDRRFLGPFRDEFVE